MKTFYTERDIEDLAAAGVTEIKVDDSVVLTDAAREKACNLGIRMSEARNISKTFYTGQDIEDIVATGAKELELDDSIVLTDLAQDKAHHLGLLIKEAGPHPTVLLPQDAALVPAGRTEPGGFDASVESVALLEKKLNTTTTMKDETSEKIKTLDPETLARIKAAIKELLPFIL